MGTVAVNQRAGISGEEGITALGDSVENGVRGQVRRGWIAVLRASLDSAVWSKFQDRDRTRHVPLSVMALSIAFTSVVAYLPAIDNSFISDDFTLLSFIQILNRDPSAIWGTVSEFFRLVSYIYFSLTFALFGLKPELHYLSSIALHAAASLLVFALVRTVTRRTLTAWAAAAFFAAYARHEEAVMWISANNETILALNCLAFLLLWELHLSGRLPRLSYFMALAAFVVALFSKESAIILVPLAMLRAGTERHSVSEAIRRTWPLLAISCAFVLLWLTQAQRNFFIADGHYTFGLHFVPVYLRSLLSMFSSATPFVVAMLILRWRSRGRIQDLSLRADSRSSNSVFFLVWLVLAIVPVSFLTYSKYIASRNTYLPSIALAALIGIIFTVLVDNAKSRRARTVCGLLLVGVLAWNLNYLWRKQDGEYVKRAAPTRRLIALLNSADLAAQKTPISICGFPLHSSIGSAAVANFTNIPVENVLFPSTCDEEGRVPFTRWDDANHRYFTPN